MGPNRLSRTAIALFGAAALLMGGCSAVPAADQPASESSPSAEQAAGADNTAAAAGPGSAQGAFSKTEVVYANLSSQGTVEGVYVVNRFDVEEPLTIRDYGSYDNRLNLTDQQSLTSADGADATVFESGEGVFFYQGNLAGAQLPWTVEATYFLDDRQMDPDLMVGMSGHVKVRITTTRNPQVNPAFADSFMQQITFTLPVDQWSNIEATGATIASAGSDQTVAFTVLPGKDGDVLLEADVRDFSMGQVSIAALPYASVVEMPDVGDVEEEMSTLSDAIAALDEGAKELADGADSLAEGTSQLRGGAGELAQGLDKVDSSSGSLLKASSQINDALTAVSAGLASADFSEMGQLGQLAEQLGALAGGLDQLSSAAAQVKDGLRASVEAMDSAAAGANTQLTQEEVGALMASPNLTDAERATVQKLAQSWGALQVMAGTYQQVRPAFEGALALLDTLGGSAESTGSLASMAAGLHQASAALESGADPSALQQLEQLKAGLSQLSSQYGQFHAGLSAYTQGVSALSDGAAALAKGADDLSDGVSTFASGTGEFGDGMGQLAQETSSLPRQMRERMDEAMADYEFPEFEPVSFVDQRNSQVEAVQFVMTLAAVEAPEPAEQKPEEGPEPTIWDRFLALF